MATFYAVYTTFPLFYSINFANLTITRLSLFPGSSMLFLMFQLEVTRILIFTIYINYLYSIQKCQSLGILKSGRKSTCKILTLKFQNYLQNHFVKQLRAATFVRTLLNIYNGTFWENGQLKPVNCFHLKSSFKNLNS